MGSMVGTISIKSFPSDMNSSVAKDGVVDMGPLTVVLLVRSLEARVEHNNRHRLLESGIRPKV